MELPNPDPVDGRPEHGGRDRHVAFTIADLQPLKGRLDGAGVTYTMSKSGRAALFCRDLDGNAFEVMRRRTAACTYIPAYGSSIVSDVLGRGVCCR